MAKRNKAVRGIDPTPEKAKEDSGKEELVAHNKAHNKKKKGDNDEDVRVVPKTVRKPAS